MTNAVEGFSTYHLVDSRENMDVGIVPAIGNLVYEYKVNGKDVLIPPESLDKYAKGHTLCCGDPFLAPWANRIAPDHYFFAGKMYLLNPNLGNLMRTDNIAIHGLVAFTPFEVVKTGAADVDGAFIISRLEFFRYPDLMAQFPFAHIIEVTYRLKAGKIENTTVITNVSQDSMPVMFGYHPFFRPDGERANWVLSNPAKEYWVLNNRLLPTGATKPAEELMPNALDQRLGEMSFDNVFSGLQRDPEGLAHFSVKGRRQKIEVVYGEAYKFAIIYAPPLPKGPLICIEPQTGPTNAFNLNHERVYLDLPVLNSGKSFKATYWIVPTGFLN